MSDMPGELIMALALKCALETFPTDALRSLARGDEIAVETIRSYAAAVLAARDERASSMN